MDVEGCWVGEKKVILMTLVTVKQRQSQNIEVLHRHMVGSSNLEKEQIRASIRKRMQTVMHNIMG